MTKQKSTTGQVQWLRSQGTETLFLRKHPWQDSYTLKDSKDNYIATFNEPGAVKNATAFCEQMNYKLQLNVA